MRHPLSLQYSEFWSYDLYKNDNKVKKIYLKIMHKNLLCHKIYQKTK